MTKSVAKIGINLLQAYQTRISPLFAPRCRFYPSCSEYALNCLRSQNLSKALIRIFLRLLKCNPFHPGGVDLP